MLQTTKSPIHNKIVLLFDIQSWVWVWRKRRGGDTEISNNALSMSPLLKAKYNITMTVWPQNSRELCFQCGPLRLP